MLTNLPTLQARHLSVAASQGDEREAALHDVSLDLYPSEFALVTGPAGSGKTLLLAALSGLRKPTRGQVLGFGSDLWSLSEGELAEFRMRHCGFLFQGSNLLPDLTAREQLEAVLLWAGVAGREARHRADDALALVGLAGKAGLRPGQLAGGEQRRVALGRALIKGSDLVFADEPTNALDPEAGRLVIGLLRDYAHERGATILVFSHEAGIGPYADQEFRIEDGTLREPEGAAGRHGEAAPWTARGRHQPSDTGIQRAWGGRGGEMMGKDN